MATDSRLVNDSGCLNLGLGSAANVSTGYVGMHSKLVTTVAVLRAIDKAFKSPKGGGGIKTMRIRFRESFQPFPIAMEQLAFWIWCAGLQDNDVDTSAIAIWRRREN